MQIGFRQNRDVLFFDPGDTPPGIFRPGELLSEPEQAEPVVDALLQNAAGPVFTFENRHRSPMIGRSGGSGKARRTRSHDQDIPVFPHTHTSNPSLLR